ncbi:hypothetical protein [Actinomadura sp. DC4]|uniref:hypothetical protein n=1 Tax=Actinomadura sp. DC4 TaxID=3055069 RepID=UPI0025B06CD2|nr:hypothetical protein [Actinomadura sp. DC4]MDN3357083.1 hypothetical protein [Actinomadura sp. DC4]
MSSDGATIAAALRRDPLYVDPAYASALPTARRAALERRIERSPVRIYVVLVPIVAGSTWQSSEQVTTVVQSHLGRDGAYVTFDADFDDVFDVVRYGGTDEEQQNARDAGWAVSYEKGHTTLAARLGRCVDLIATGQGSAAYTKAKDTEFPPRPAPRPVAHRAGGHGDLTIGVPAAVAGVAAIVGGLVWLRRRRARAAMEALRLPRTVFGTALEAGDDDLRARAERDLIALGESLDGGEQALDAALDAYDAASRTLDRARSTADLAGVLALIQAARGGPPLCYFDPRHGDGTITVHWRAPGTRPRLEVRVCAACAKAVRDRRAPDVVLDRGRPYYEAATPWARTGYGQFGDLVGSVRGE